MARLWFTSAPLPGHLDWGGLLKTAQTLQARGHEVVWVSEPRIRGLVARVGVPFAGIEASGWRWPPPPLPGPGEFVNENMTVLRYRRALDTWLSEDLVSAGAAALLELAEEAGAPDGIVTDPFLAAAALAAEALDVPLVVGGWASGPPLDEAAMLAEQRELGGEATARLTHLCERFGLAGVNFSDGPAPAVQSPRLHISYFSRYWHQADRVLPQTEFVGGTVTPPEGDPPAWLADLPPDRPPGLVTLGSTFTGDLAFFARAAGAVAEAGFTPLVVIGVNPIAPGDKDWLKARLPGGTRLLNWVPYDHVFPRLKVAVHHGGMGTTHAAIVHGVPQVIAPHAADQRLQARRASQAKVGLHLSPRDVAEGQLVPAVRAITTTDWVLAAVEQLAANFAALGGVEKAANLIAGVMG